MFQYADFPPLSSEFYENYGITSFNLGMDNQPLCSSYYWMLEAYEHHPKTLKTVVFDVSVLRSPKDEFWYEKSLTGMEFCLNHLNAVKDMSDSLDTFLTYFSSLYSYHTRWKEVTENDFLDFSNNPINSVDSSTWGYNFVSDMLICSMNIEDLDLPQYKITDKDKLTQFYDEELYYLYKMIEFCSENDIQLLLIKTPVCNWNDGEHNAVQELADNYSLDFLDFNYEPYYSEMGYNEATDSADRIHMNYLGAKKLTNWLGKYLTEYCNATDVRGDERYSFMETDLIKYCRNIISVGLDDQATVCDYISTLNQKDDYTTLISLHGKGTSQINEKQRKKLKKLGLESLTKYGYLDSYYACIDDGEVLCEEGDGYLSDSLLEMEEEEKPVDNLSTIENIDSVLEEKFNESEDNDETDDGIFEGYMDDGTYYSVMNDQVIIGDTTYSFDSNGLNIIVYDNQLGKVVDQTSFDIFSSNEREPYDLENALNEYLDNGGDPDELTGNLKKLYLYNQRVDAYYAEIDNGSFYEYLTSKMDEGNNIICLSVKEEAADAFDETARNAFSSLGLYTLSELASGEYYVGIIDDGDVVKETRGFDEITESYSDIDIASGNDSSIVIDDQEFSLNGNGMNVVVIDKDSGEVIDQISFDTHTYATRVGEGS